MPSDLEICFDFNRASRIGMGEAVFCKPKSVEQIEAILRKVLDESRDVLLTRLSDNQFEQLDENLKALTDYCEKSGTGFFNLRNPRVPVKYRCAVVSAGTSDAIVAQEAIRTLQFSGIQPHVFHDRGVAGLWRLTEILPELAEFDAVIAVAGMDAALPTVLGGAIPAPIIAVPTSVGYGVAEGGRTALNSILASCSSGLMTVNIDNGYGAACAVIRIFNSMKKNEI